MKKGLFFALLVLTPLFTFSSPDRNENISGVWEDYRTGLHIQIKPAKRRGILVKRLDGRYRNKWVRYDRIRRGLYDDCRGSTLRITRNGLKWSSRWDRRTFYLERSYADYKRRRSYRDRRGNRDRGYYREYDRDRDRIRNSAYNISGDWYCDAHGIDIDIAYFNDGIRVRRYDSQRNRYDDWYEYKRDSRNRNRFYGQDDKYYELQGDQIVFYDQRRNKSLRFKKKRR